MYNADSDREIFSILRTNSRVKHYIKWNDVKGTGSGGLQVLGPLEEAKYCAVLVVLGDDDAHHLFDDMRLLREEMLNKTGLATLVFPVDKIG
jgi:hypothetical protein